MSNKLEATIGDKIVLYKNGLPFKTVTIVQRKLHMNGLQEIFVDTIDEDGEYGNTYPLYRTVAELLESYQEDWDRGFMILRDEKTRLQLNVGDKVLRKEDNQEYIILYIGHMRDTRRAKNEYYLILEDAKHKTNKSTCIYSFDINADFELIKDKITNKIEPLPNMEFISASGKILKCDINQRNISTMYDKRNELVEYINKEK